MNNIKFLFKNIGVIESAEVPLNNLTILVGKNSVSKTYLTYLIWGFLDFIDKSNALDDIAPDYAKYILNEAGDIKEYVDLSIFAERIDEILDRLSVDYIKFIPQILSFGDDAIPIKDTSFAAKVLNPSFSYEQGLQLKFSVSGNITVSGSKQGSILPVLIVKSDNVELSEEYKNAVIDNVVVKILEYLLGQILPKPFIITSERTGISIFYRELDTRRAALLESLTATNRKHIFDDIDGLISSISRYPMPVKRNMDFVRDLFEISKNKTDFDMTAKKFITTNISKGKYSFDKQANQIFYSVGRGDSTVKLPIHTTSSSIKSLLMLDAYVNYIANSGQILIIDEPELNLHPDNQRLIARFLAMLVNKGVKLLFTTHSDYIIKELNNLIMLYGLEQDKQGIAIQQIKKKIKTKYSSDMFLAKENVNCITICEGEHVTTVDATVDEYGINAKIIDDEINAMGDTSDILYDFIGE